MSGEMVLVGRAIFWGPLVALGGAGAAYLLRGSDGAASVLLAAGLVLGNALAAAVLSAGAARAGTAVSAMIALPSFAIRMGALMAALQALKGRTFMDEPSFVLAFGLAVAMTLVVEARTWKSTPWLARTLKGDL